MRRRFEHYKKWNCQLNVQHRGTELIVRVDHLRVESRGDFNAHACRKQHEIEIAQVRLLVPRHVVVLNGMREDWICCTGSVLGSYSGGHVVQSLVCLAGGPGKTGSMAVVAIPLTLYEVPAGSSTRQPSVRHELRETCSLASAG